MKLIDKLGKALNQNFNARSINILVVLGISILYIGLMDIVIKIVFYVHCYFDKTCPSSHRIVESMFKFIFVILSPISLANYYYNRSRFEAAEVGKIRIIIILLCAAFLCFSSIVLLHESIITHSFLYLCIQNFLTKLLVCILGICLFFIIRSEVVTKLTPNTSYILYLIAHLFWILNMFVIISYARVSGTYKKVFNKTGFIIIAALTFIAIAYSFVQQYFYKRLAKSEEAKEINGKFMNRIINLD